MDRERTCWVDESWREKSVREENSRSAKHRHRFEFIYGGLCFNPSSFLEQIPYLVAPKRMDQFTFLTLVLFAASTSLRLDLGALVALSMKSITWVSLQRRRNWNSTSLQHYQGKPSFLFYLKSRCHF
ncbi:hypothetical protein SADUNF_Sadunf03G0021000 [Salix dunnii]|uniref:Uncharacterized protein n=1 Tax=Salix dunnii TaxID=1413687 RepID=A0A835N363_9ROSI|nr:hypothetical protein SADUNF_Sadunf03G0021000 [Salix dunnii]